MKFHDDESPTRVAAEILAALIAIMAGVVVVVVTIALALTLCVDFVFK